MKIEAIAIAGVILLLLSIVILLLRYYMYHYGQGEQLSELGVTSTDAAVHTLDAFLRKLRRFPDLKKIMDRGQNREKVDFGTYVIPGLRASRTIGASGGLAAMCTAMTPQGLAVTDDYLFISAYCHEHAHNSVIYMVDKHTHRFVKEIVLPNQAHAGGLAYDAVNRVLWVSGYQDGKAYANAYTLEQILSYDLSSANLPLSYTYQYPLEKLRKNSFMCCKDGVLYAGYFCLRGSGVLHTYRIGDGGALVFGQKGECIPDQSFDIPSKIQGMTFSQEHVILVKSYGLRFSKMLVLNRPKEDQKTRSVRGQTPAVFTMPDRMESVCYWDGRLYMLYESASCAYRRRTFLAVDRIITCHIDAILARPGENRERIEKTS